MKQLYLWKKIETMTSLLIEIENPQDVQLFQYLVERLGFKVKTLKNDKKMDETDFLLSSELNKKRLLQSIENVKNGHHLTDIDLEEIKKQYSL
jgi:hypothetical protein